MWRRNATSPATVKLNCQWKWQHPGLKSFSAYVAVFAQTVESAGSWHPVRKSSWNPVHELVSSFQGSSSCSWCLRGWRLSVSLCCLRRSGADPARQRQRQVHSSNHMFYTWCKAGLGFLDRGGCFFFFLLSNLIFCRGCFSTDVNHKAQGQSTGESQSYHCVCVRANKTRSIKRKLLFDVTTFNHSITAISWR